MHAENGRQCFIQLSTYTSSSDSKIHCISWIHYVKFYDTMHLNMHAIFTTVLKYLNFSK